MTSTILSEYDAWTPGSPAYLGPSIRRSDASSTFEALSIAFASIGRCVEANAAIDYVGSLLGSGDVTVHP